MHTVLNLMLSQDLAASVLPTEEETNQNFCIDGGGALQASTHTNLAADCYRRRENRSV